MIRMTKIQNFIKNATEEDWQRLAEHVNNAPRKKDSLPAPELGFDFSYTGIVTELERRGLITLKHKPSRSTTPTSVSTIKETPVAEYPPFIIDDIRLEIKKISRSVQLDEDVSTRLHTLEDNKRQYTHSAILNQLLRDGLSKYGY